MSLNSAATPDGGEIGRAQALQAEACRAMPCVKMNPVLLKPSTDTGAQVILLGKIWGQVTASDYHTRRVEQLFPDVLAEYLEAHRLRVLGVLNECPDEPPDLSGARQLFPRALSDPSEGQ